MIEEPILPKPAQRDNKLVDKPSLAAATPKAKLTICSKTLPRNVAKSAPPNVMPYPKVAPSICWDTQA